MSLKQAAVFGLVFGIVAALVVWYLERFELNRLHGEVREYLGNRDKFEDFLREKDQSG
jgi:hypothetical protein